MTKNELSHALATAHDIAEQLSELIALKRHRVQVSERLIAVLEDGVRHEAERLQGQVASRSRERV